jgi:UDP-N-acetylmuramoylalanine--D-glutamate ligase
MNEKSAMTDVVEIAGYSDQKISINRILDKKIIELNDEGFINGHTPLSSLIAFITYFIAYENDIKNIILSNEDSANESTVKGEDVNHQYSKTLEFENDFNSYTSNFFGIDIKYFSILRPLNELTIAKLFSKYKQYHKAFRSCNLGSKKDPWEWCNSCAKCLFTYIMLYAYLSKEEMINIFGENLLDKESLLDDFKALCGSTESKPFECVGTIKEVRRAMTIISHKDDSVLSKYYKDNYEDIDEDLTTCYNTNNNLDSYYDGLLKRELEINMYQKILDKLKNKKIAILGFGREGKSTYKFIRNHLKDEQITILDKNTNLLNDNEYLKEDSNVLLLLGDDYLEHLDDSDIIFKSPGIKIPDIEKYMDKITSEVNLLLEDTDIFTIGITGTKGKSTTSSLIYEVLKNNNLDVHLCGNIGIPVFDFIEECTPDTVLVVEMSAYQTEFIKQSPNIGIILNLFEEHLDYFGTKEAYYNSKLNMFRYQYNDYYGFYSCDNEELKKRVEELELYGKMVRIISSKDTSIDNAIICDEKKIYSTIKGEAETLYDITYKRKLKGRHNIENIMFALGISIVLDLDTDKTIEAINNFNPLPHRMEYFGTYEDIKFYNDSIATIPEATINCIETLKDVDTLVIGGKDRGINYDELVDYINNSKIRHVICLPDTGHMLSERITKETYKVESMEEVAKIAFEVTKPGKSCVLSPAASSYNKYKNFEERGNDFKKMIISYSK